MLGRALDAPPFAPRDVSTRSPPVPALRAVPRRTDIMHEAEMTATTSAKNQRLDARGHERGAQVRGRGAEHAGTALVLRSSSMSERSYHVVLEADPDGGCVASAGFSGLLQPGRDRGRSRRERAGGHPSDHRRHARSWRTDSGSRGRDSSPRRCGPFGYRGVRTRAGAPRASAPDRHSCRKSGAPGALLSASSLRSGGEARAGTPARCWSRGRREAQARGPR